jgi:hypothetical protein
MRVTIVLLSLVAIFIEPVRGQAPTETFLLQMPEGFKVGFQKGSMAEWVPAGKTVEDWSEMITVQVYRVDPRVTQASFLQGVGSLWLRACPETPKQNIFNGQTNGYPVSMLVLSCPHNVQTGKPETTVFRVILGNDSLYSIQRAYRLVPTREQFAATMKFMATVSLCDKVRPGHPCPEGQTDAPN